ncbi:hypothetical protein OQH61_02170 [Helicobacter sp. MIT 21-1697]|uniref:hypothetical protein n=1 Tax=Helicobacter sp. MIT 21-1697 TaxID=2993733 RepID=UPI00224A5358|nr:hypothetical protein [Helicobacter sp. MIT 21-1697]MCX2716538.1 hypothetical protein [Helicobacter sp. MIT 21-1697]
MTIKILQMILTGMFFLACEGNKEGEKTPFEGSKVQGAQEVLSKSAKILENEKRILSLDEVLKNLLKEEKLDNINSLTQEQCENIKSINENYKIQTNEEFIEEQSCTYAQIQVYKADIVRQIHNHQISTDTHSLDSLLHYKIIAYLSIDKEESVAVRDELEFEINNDSLWGRNVCNRFDGLEFEASCTLYMSIFDDLAQYIKKKQNLSETQMQTYNDSFENITRDALIHLDEEAADMP